MSFTKLKLFTGTSVFLLLSVAMAPAGWAQMSRMNEANCPEAYRGKVVDVDNEWVTVERPNGERELLDLSRTEQSLLGVAMGNELVMCEDGTVTNSIENMEAMGDDNGLRDRIAETFRRLEEEQAARRRQAAQRMEEMRMERMRARPQPVRVAPAAAPTPMPEPEPVRVEEAVPVRGLW
jgi:hypothetical protein